MEEQLHCQILGFLSQEKYSNLTIKDIVKRGGINYYYNGDCSFTWDNIEVFKIITEVIYGHRNSSLFCGRMDFRRRFD